MRRSNSPPPPIQPRDLISRGRDVALARVAEHCGRFPDIDFARERRSMEDPREAALARSLEAAVLRHWAGLRRIAEVHLKRPWATLDAPAQSAILVGAAQLMLFDRIPDHAAVDECVQWAKRPPNGERSGLVNAVLRRVTAMRKERVGAMPAQEWAQRRDVFPRGDGSAWILSERSFDEGLVARLAAQCSLTTFTADRWLSAFGQSDAIDLAAATLVQAPTIVTGIAGTGDGLTPHSEDGFFVYDGSPETLGTLLASARFARVQDPASARAVAATASRPAQLIIDLCAGRGTKTLQLAQVHPDAQIIATDTDERRRTDLAARLKRLDDPRISVVTPAELKQWEGKADLVLLDVPCSNSGVLARRVEARHRLDKAHLESLQSLQRTIAAHGARLLAPGGTIVWSTCSLEAEENSQGAQELVRLTGGRLLQETLIRPSGLPGDSPQRIATGAYHAIIGT